MSLKKKIIDILSDSIKVKEEIKKEKYINTILKIAEEIISCLRRNGKVILFGNGGSAADAQHIAAELMGKFKLNRCALPAIALTTNTSIITALSNDYSYDIIFAKQLEGLAQKDDIAIGISTSGKAKNVILGIKKAKEMGLKTIAFTGSDGGPLAKEARICIIAPSKNTPRIQEAHITIGHILCELVEEILFNPPSPRLRRTKIQNQMPIEAKIKNLRQLKKIVADLKSKGKRIVFTNGCFDILHYGHVKYLKRARRYGDILLVAINSDRSVKAIKGKDRPIVPGSDRARMVAALEPVDYITTFNELTPLKTIQALEPDVLVKGGDWQREDIVGKDFVESYHGRVVRIPYIKGYSTSSIIKKIKRLG